MYNEYYIPTREEFHDYVTRKGWGNWEKKLWEVMQDTHWLKNNGERPTHWTVMVSVRNGILMQKFGFKKSYMKETQQKGAKTSKKVSKVGQAEELPNNGLHYVAYTDGSCDNLSQEKAGGSAYILIKDGEVIKIKNHGQLNTTNNRMELLAIISAVNSCPQGAYVDVYTDSQYSILVLSKDFKPKLNADLYELYKKCAAHVAVIRFHWVKGHNGCKYNEMADELAYAAYCEVCDTYNIEKSKRH